MTKSEGINKNDIIKQYIAILALIPAIAYIIGMGVVGVNLGMFGSFKYPIETAVVGGGNHSPQSSYSLYH